MHDAGAAGDLTGASRAWRFGDEQPLDVVRTVGNAVLRGGPARPGPPAAAGGRRLRGARDRAAHARPPCACSSTCRTRWCSTAPGRPPSRPRWRCTRWSRTQFPQDALQVIGFSNYARALRPHELATLDSDMVQGTNLQHALMLAGRFLDRHPDAEPVVLVVTDGEPTAHLTRRGEALFDWPPSPETLELTLAEVDRMTRRGRDAQRLHARRRAAAAASSSTRWPGATAAGCSPRTPTGSATTSCSDYLRSRQRGPATAAG